jgi:hypothetical protein
MEMHNRFEKQDSDPRDAIYLGLSLDSSSLVWKIIVSFDSEDVALELRRRRKADVADFSTRGGCTTAVCRQREENRKPLQFSEALLETRNAVLLKRIKEVAGKSCCMAYNI